jgi:hypothetical protein
MIEVPARLSQTRSAARRGAEWLAGRQAPDGSLRDAASLAAYYKTPFALTVAGHNEAAERMLDFIAHRFLTKDGDLDGDGVEWFERYRIYPHAWLAIAASMRGRFDIACPLIATVIGFHDDETGGFSATGSPNRVDSRRGPQEVMSTSLAGLACLWLGRLDVARRTGGWLQRLYDAQPDLSAGLYHVWDRERGLVTAFSAGDAKAYLVDATQPEQWYFQYGISAAFLSSLSAATGDRRWLQLAQAFLRASAHCRDDVYGRFASGKIGWGAAWTYRASGDEADRDLAERVGAQIVDLQNEDGSWSASSSYGSESRAVDPTMDLTAELTALLSCIALAAGR